MTPKQGESENTGGKRIKKSIGQKEEKGKGKKMGGEKTELLFVAVAFQFKFFSFFLLLFYFVLFFKESHT